VLIGSGGPSGLPAQPWCPARGDHGRDGVRDGQQGERLGRTEETQQQILDLLRGRPTG